MVKIVFIHPHSMPSKKNRAVFQRPLVIARNYEAILITRCKDVICEELDQTFKHVHYFSNKMAIFRIKAILYCLSLKRDNTIIYIYPQWGFTVGLVLSVLGYRVVYDMQHTPYYYRDFSLITSLSLTRSIYFRLRYYWMYVTAQVSLKRAYRVVAMSLTRNSGFAKIFSERFDVSKEKLIALPNGIVQDFVSWSDQTEIVIGYAGNIQKSKITALFAISAELTSRNVSHTVYICGQVTPSYKKEFTQTASKMDSVEFLGELHHEDLLNLYKKMNFGFFDINEAVVDHFYSIPGKIMEYIHYGVIPITKEIDFIQRLLEEKYYVGLDRPVSDTCDDIIRFFNEKDLFISSREKNLSAIRHLSWDILNKSLLNELNIKTE